MEVYFEYLVESEKMSDGEYATPEEALEAAQKQFQELCDEGDYEYGRGDVVILVLHDGEVILESKEYQVDSVYDFSGTPYLQSEFV